MRYALLFWLALAAPAAAEDACHDLWFTKNLILDRAGMCFGTNLGRAIFNNANCSTSAPKISAADDALIELVEAREEALQCKIDNFATRLPVKMVWLRAELDTLPIASFTPYSCEDWKGPFTPLYAGVDAAKPKAIGEIEDGDDVYFEHDPISGWQFVTVRRSLEFVAGGWFAGGMDKAKLKAEGLCGELKG